MEKSAKTTFKEKLKLVSTIVSWVIFGILIICAILLVYYFVATKIYEKKGKGYEPAFFLYTIISPSMVPSINVYDVVVNTKITSPEDIKVGDVITYNSTDFTIGKSISVTHRVQEVMIDSEGNYLYKTKGDNNMVADPVAVQYSNVTGKVLMKIPQLGRVQFFVASKAGWMLIVVVPALYVIIKDILKLLKVIGPDTKVIKKKKTKNNILFIPIKRKPLYLPFHGYKDSQGNKEKFTLSSLNPFTFDRTSLEEKEPITTNLIDIYNDLRNIVEDQEKDNKK